MNNFKYPKLLFPSLLVITFLLGKYTGGFVSWFLFDITLVLLVYLWIIGKFSFKDIRVSRNFDKYGYTAGENIEVELEIWNKMSFPHSYILVNDQKPEKYKQREYKNLNLIFPWSRPKSKIKYTIPNSIRGVHKWEQIELTTGDVFGFKKIKKILPSPNEVIVYPKIYSIRNWNTINTNKVGITHSHNKVSEDTSSVIGVRDYRYGDRFNRIHWKQSAKTGQLMTKEFETVTTNNFMFFLNQNAKAYADNDHFEKTMELTASLIKHSIDQKFPVGFVSDHSLSNHIFLSREQEHLLRIFRVLAMTEPKTDIYLKEMVLTEIPHLPKGTTMVLVTPKKDNELYELLGELAIRKIKVEVFVVNYYDKYFEDKKNLNSFNEINIAIHNISVAALASDTQGGIAIV